MRSLKRVVAEHWLKKHAVGMLCVLVVGVVAVVLLTR
jgi:hypothetical protein